MLLIFDLDNTLVDRDFAFEKCLREIFLSRHCELLPADLRAIKQVDKRGCSNRAQFCEYFSHFFPQLKLNGAEIWQRFLNIPNFVCVDKNIKNLIAVLRKHHSVCLLSNGSSDMQRRKLTNAELDLSFDEVFISGELGLEKPDQAIFEQVLSCFNAKNNRCIMIGDDPKNDILPAFNMGMHSILVHSMYKPNEISSTSNRMTINQVLNPSRDDAHHSNGRHHVEINSIFDVEEAILACSI